MITTLTTADAEAIARMLIDAVLSGDAIAGVIDLDRDTASRARAELVPAAWDRLCRDAERVVEEYRDVMADVAELRSEIGDLVGATYCGDSRSERARLMDADAWAIYRDGWTAAVRWYRDALAAVASSV
jgi:hypothetical protein